MYKKHKIESEKIPIYLTPEILKKTFRKTECYCPFCSEQHVFVNGDGGDYYLGETHYCMRCTWSFFMPDARVADKDSVIDTAFWAFKKLWQANDE